jgi:hypothetical protein
VGSEPESLLGYLSGNTFHFVENPAGSHNRYPSLRGSFAFTHANFSRFLGNRFVRKYPYPYSGTSFDVPGHGNTGRLDLPSRQPTAIDGLQAKLAEVKTTASLGEASHSAFLLFSKFYLFGAKH